MSVRSRKNMGRQQLRIDSNWEESEAPSGPMQILRVEKILFTGNEPEEKQIFYAEHGDVEMRRALACTTESREVLLILSKNDDDEDVLNKVMERVIQNEIPDDDEAISDSLIKNEHATFRIHDTFSRRDMHKGVKALVADVTHYAKVLERLSRNSDYFVLECVAGNKHTPISILKRLGKHENAIVRWAVANSTHTPAGTLQKLRGDADESVRDAAVETLRKQMEEEIAENFRIGTGK